MKITGHHIFFLCWILGLTACSSFQRRKKLNPNITLRASDKIPYGTYYAYDNLPALFPRADIMKNIQSPSTFYYDSADENDRPRRLKTYIIIGPRVFPEKEELESMVRFAAAGHQLFISSLAFGESLLKTLNLKISVMRPRYDSLRLSLYRPQNGDSLNFTYPGLGLGACFESFDTAHALVLGRNDRGKANFIRIGFRHGGAIYVHLAPLAFTNFFLLHRQNASYYDIALSCLPKETNELIWDDYFRKKQPENFSILHFLLGNRSLRWAFWLVVGLFLLLYAVESKRKQRAIVARTALGNSSVDFVKTIGRLYLQQKNNQNLAIKMITAFLEHVRLNYQLQTSALNDDFSVKLALRTGTDAVTIRKLVGAIHYARMQNAITDQELMDLHQQIEIFNKPV